MVGATPVFFHEPHCPEIYCCVLDASCIYISLRILNSPHLLVLFRVVQRSPYRLGSRFMWPELRVPSGLTDHNQSTHSTSWAFYQFRLPHSFLVSWNPDTTMIHLKFCPVHPLCPFLKGVSLTRADFQGSGLFALVLYHFLVIGLWRLPTPFIYLLIFSLKIQDSTLPNLQR